MKKYILNLTKEELDSIKYALSIAIMQLKYKEVSSANLGNFKTSNAYKEQSKKMEELLKDLKNIEEED